MGAGATRGGAVPHARAAALGLGAALAATAWDPSAPAADAKRAIGLAVSVVALAMGISRLSRGDEPCVRVPAAAALWLGFVAWSLATLAWGAPSGVGALGVWVGASAMLLASLLLPRDMARRAAGIAAAAAGGASAILALAQAASGARGIAIHGGHGNPNWFGLVLAIALPLSIDLAAELRRASSKMWMVAAGAAAIEVPALLLSRSRTAWLATLAGLALWVFCRRAARGGGRTIAAGVVTLALVGFSAGAQASDPDAAEIESVRGAEDTPIAEALEGRMWIWRASADAAVAGLPFGEGLGAFAHAFLDAQGARLAALPPKLASRSFANATTAHCDWLEVTVDSGLPALALLAAAVAMGIIALVRERRGAEAASLAAFAICAAGDSPMRQPGAVFLLALLLGACPTARPRAPRVANAAVPEARARRSLRLPYPRVVFTLTLGGSALLLAIAASTWLGARRLTSAREDLLPEARLPVLASAARIDPRSGEAALALGLAKLELGDPAGALHDLARSRALLANIGTDVAIGNAHAASGDPFRAAAAYRRALARHPGSFRAHVNLADALAKLRAFDEAEAHLAVARALWPGHPKLAAVAERARRARIEAEADREP